MILAIVGTLYSMILLVLFLAKPRTAILFFFSTKFTVDLLWDSHLLPGVSVLRIVGTLFPVLLLFAAWPFRRSVVKHPLWLLMVIWVILNVIAGLWGIANSYWTFFPLAASPIGWMHVGDWFFRLLNHATALLLVPLFLNKNDHAMLARAIMISTTLPVLAGVWQIAAATPGVQDSFGLFPRVTGGYHDAGVMAIAMFAGCVFSFLNYRLSPDRKNRIWSMSHLVICSVVLYFTFTRSMWVSITMFFLLAFWLERRWRLVWTTVVIGLSIVFFLPMTVKRFEKELTFIQQPAKTENQDSELDKLGTGRIWLWKDAFGHFGKLDWISRIIGSGGSYGSHNQYIAVLLKNGMVGLSVFLSLLFRIGMVYQRQLSPIGLFGWSLFLTVTWLASLFLQPWDNQTFSVAFLAILGINLCPPYDGVGTT